MPFDLTQAPLPVSIAVFLAAGVCVWIIGTRLTRVLDALAIRTGMGHALVGMLLLGGITSLPELANVITASGAGVPALAINNLLGSAAINILLLAVVDAFIGRGAVTSSVRRPGVMMMCGLCMILLAVAALAIIVGDVAIAGVGIWSLGVTGLSLAFFALSADYDRRAPWVVRDAGKTSRETDRPPSTGLRRLVLETLGLAVLIYAAGALLSMSGEALAGATGLSAGAVGFLMIGTVTSLPELSTIVAALRLRRHEMAFGQVLGTNFVNLSLFGVADMAFGGGPVINELGKFEAALALLGCVLTGIFLVGLLERRDPRIMRMGYDSLLVIVVFVLISIMLVTAL